MKTAFIFANGIPDDGAMVRQALHNLQPATIIAADGGARIAQYFGLTPHIIIGDMDSISPASLADFEQKGVIVQRHPPAKDETDLELAFWYAHAEGYRIIRVFGAMGGRFDQTLANVSLLASPIFDDADVAIVSDNQAIRLLASGEHHIEGHSGDTISLIPFGGDAVGITTRALEYPLTAETLPFGTSRGISNVMQTEKASLHLESGKLILVHTLGRA